MIKGSGMTGFSPAYFNQGFDILSEFPVVPLNRLLLRFFFFTFYTFHLTSSILFSVGKDQDVSCSLVYGRSAGRGFKGGGGSCALDEMPRDSRISHATSFEHNFAWAPLSCGPKAFLFSIFSFCVADSVNWKLTCPFPNMDLVRIRNMEWMEEKKCLFSKLFYIHCIII